MRIPYLFDYFGDLYALVMFYPFLDISNWFDQAEIKGHLDSQHEDDNDKVNVLA